MTVKSGINSVDVQRTCQFCIMAGSKSLLVIFLIAFANAKIINGFPDEIEDDNEDTTFYDLNDYNHDEESSEETQVTAQFSEGGVDVTDLASGNEDETEGDEESESSQAFASVGKSIDMSPTVGKDVQMQGIGPYGLSINARNGKVTIESSIIYDTITGMTDTTSSIINNVVMIGNENGKMVYSGKPNQLMTIEGNQCTSSTYNKRQKISTEILSPAECAKIKSEIHQKKHGSYSTTSWTASGPVVNNFNNGPPSYQQSWGNSKPSKPKPTNNNYNNNNYNSGSPFGNNWPFGPNNNPFGPGFPFNNVNSAKPSGSNNIYNLNSGSGSNGRRTSRRRVQAQPNYISSWLE